MTTPDFVTRLRTDGFANLRVRTTIDGTMIGDLAPHATEAAPNINPNLGGRVLPLFNQVPFTGDTIELGGEAGRTNGAAPTAYGTSIATETSFTTVAKVLLQPMPIRATASAWKSVLADKGLVSNALDKLIRFDLARDIDVQLLTGNGTVPNLIGASAASGVPTLALAAQTRWDAMVAAAETIRNLGYVTPIYGVVNALDLKTILQEKNSAGSALYNKDVMEQYGFAGFVTAPTQPQGTILFGAFGEMADVYVREDVTITMALDHGGDFVAGVVRFMAEWRGNIWWNEPAAGVQITGI